MRLPTYIHQIQGVSQDGPNVLVLGGTHGDEQIGIEVVKRLSQLLGVSGSESCVRQHPNVAGNLFFGFGNPQAMKMGKNGKRGVSNKDLNRCFAPEHLEDPQGYDSEDYRRARELAPLLSEIDFLVDLHSTSSKSEPFICFGKDSPEHRDLYELIPVRMIITDPMDPSVLAKPFGQSVLGTTDYWVNTFGGSEWSLAKHGKKRGVALCYESGHLSDLSKVDEVFETTLRLLLKTGVIKQAFADELRIIVSPLKIKERQELFKLVYCGLAKEHHPAGASFVYEERMQENWLEVKKGQLLGHYPESKEPVYIPENGYLVFVKVPDKIREKRDSLFYIAQRISE